MKWSHCNFPRCVGANEYRVYCMTLYFHLSSPISVSTRFNIIVHIRTSIIIDRSWQCTWRYDTQIGKILYASDDVSLPSRPRRSVPRGDGPRGDPNLRRSPITDLAASRWVSHRLRQCCTRITHPLDPPRHSVHSRRPLAAHTRPTHAAHPVQRGRCSRRPYCCCYSHSPSDDTPTWPRSTADPTTLSPSRWWPLCWRPPARTANRPSTVPQRPPRPRRPINGSSTISWTRPRRRPDLLTSRPTVWKTYVFAKRLEHVFVFCLFEQPVCHKIRICCSVVIIVSTLYYNILWSIVLWFVSIR